MINTISDIKKVTGSLFLSVILKLTPFFKASFIVGSYCAFFSLSHSILPLTGAFAGLPGALAAFVGALCARAIICPMMTVKLLALHLPGLAASIAWIDRYKVIRMALPLLCMVLFVAHPVGAVAWAYSLYWLIPIALYVTDQDGVFARSLSSTLVAHAVGSTIWLYADPMTPAVWMGLIPVVAVERCMFACGMSAAYMAICAVRKRVSVPKAVLSKISAQCEYVRN